jgi:hypothetical protein
MRRIGPAVLALTIGMVGCGGSDSSNTPSVTQVTVTVQHNGAPLENVVVQETVAVDSVDVLDGGHSDASGHITFAVPSSTSTGNLCVVSYWSPDGVTTNQKINSQCFSLNSLPASVVLNYTD